MSKIAIIAALPGELKPLVRGWQRCGRNRWMGRIGEWETIAVAGGIGAAAAERAVEWVFADAIPEALVSYGWAGALTCAVKPPTACAISEVLVAGDGQTFVTNHTGGYRLITLDHVARADEKRGLAERYKSVLVDMEAATVARMAAERNIQFYCFKGVSDGYNDQLPDFSQFIDSNGELRIAPFLAYTAFHPKYWPSMLRLGKNSGAAASELANLTEEYLKHSLLVS